MLGGKHSAFMRGAGLSGGGVSVSFRRNTGRAAAAAASSPLLLGLTPPDRCSEVVCSSLGLSCL